MMNTAVRKGSVSTTETVLAALGAMLLGTFLLFGVGFAQPQVLHDAAHDGRHSFAFPCH
ncbi:CbtB domain-containing protein [Azospirillum sp. SYSU D00513]|uniref:CbtB domain-containing protein n=1 Tax=Azospirillum sp. SYSU D00513 TaxID=2812561 RepID=UPI001A968929|nr:CbtB domain-containing protein [Azospirillum sp. SYSU D00513]